MTHKEAINNLMVMLKKYSFTAKEKEAITAAIGALSWFSLADSRIKSIKNKREKTKRIF